MYYESSFLNNISSKRFKEEIKRFGTQENFAESANISIQLLNGILNKKKSLTEEKLLLFSEILKVRPEYLIGRDDFRTTRDKILNEMNKPGEISETYKDLLIKLGYGLSYKETDDYLNPDVIITDQMSFKHTLSEEDFDKVMNEIFEFIEFKIERI